LFTLVLEEALLLVAIGGALRLALASFGLKVVVAVAPAALPRAEEVAIDWRVLLFSAAAIVLATIVCGLIPAWRLSRTQPMESLKAASAASTETGDKLRVREWMVGFEVALCTILLIAGSVLMVSFLHVLHSDTGFDVAHVIAQDVSFLNPKYQHGVRQTFVEQIIPKLKQIPGVDIAAATNRLPLICEDWVSELTDADQPSLTRGFARGGILGIQHIAILLAMDLVLRARRIDFVRAFRDRTWNVGSRREEIGTKGPRGPAGALRDLYDARRFEAAADQRFSFLPPLSDRAHGLKAAARDRAPHATAIKAQRSAEVECAVEMLFV
jgi:hypothetical protein